MMKGGLLMEFGYAKLRGRIVEKFGTQEKFAEALGISNTTMSLKMTGKRAFSQRDIIKWCELLDIDKLEAGSYFFS